MGIFTYNYKIKYSDISRNNKLTLKAMVGMLQEVAGLHSEQAGYGLNDIPNTHITWLLLNWKIKMFSHPHLNEMLTFKTWPRTIEKIYSYRDFEIFDSNNNLVAIATSKWVLIDADTKRIKKVTPDICEAYGGTVDKNVFDCPIDEKPTIPEDLNLNFNYTIQRRDIDTNGHVNNLHYIDFALETLDEKTYNENEFDNLEIMYKKEIKYKENINCYYSFENNKHIITIKSEDNSVVHAIIKLS